MIQKWDAPIELSAQERQLLSLTKKQPLWRFIRENRHQILSEDVLAALHAMYAESGRGLALSPERLALALILQVANGVADQDVPLLTATDRLWRMVLNGLDEELDTPMFGQGTVFNFRERARSSGFLDVLLQRTVQLARENAGFSHKRLRALIDSSPLLGAGRVEDSFNLIGRAISQLVEVAAAETGLDAASVASELALTVVSAKSVKAALDVDWRRPDAREAALKELLVQLKRVEEWLVQQVPKEIVARPPVSTALETVHALVGQDVEPDPTVPPDQIGAPRFREGGADRQVSLSDPDMRHGRKTKTRVFVGYKRHALVDADVRGLVIAVHVDAANEREYSAAEPLLTGAEQAGFSITETHIDRGYLPSDAVHERRRMGMKLVTKPPTLVAMEGRFTKADFTFDEAKNELECPNGRVIAVVNLMAAYPAKGCVGCPLTARCLPESGRKVVRLHPHESFHREMTADLATPSGRAARRVRVAVEHVLARFSAIQGVRARYRGLAKNQFHATAVAVVANLHVLNGQAARLAA